jgi:superfamily II RNA helicase
MARTLADLLKDSAYRLDPFQPEHIAALEAGKAVALAHLAAANPPDEAA